MVRKLVSCVIWAYAGALGAYLVWTDRNKPRPWWLKAFSPFAFWAFLPSLALPVIGWKLGSTGTTLAGGIAAVSFAHCFLRRFVPLCGSNPGTGSVRLKLLTANLLKTNTDMDGVARVLLAESADIVAVQELRPAQARALRARLADAYPYQALEPGSDADGMGLFSRYPFVSVARYQGGRRANPLQVARFSIRGRETWLLNVHPRNPILRCWGLAGLSIPCFFDTRERETDLRDIVALMASLEGDAIAMGDWNTSDECDVFRWIPSQWRDAYREVAWGPGFTYPVDAPLLGVRFPFPLVRIDHIFYTGRWRARRARIGRMPGSDHRYVVAELYRDAEPEG